MKTFKIKGFTLIELMVVIAIIGLLSSVILAALGNTKLRAKDSAVKQIIGQMRNIYATQYAENPNNPSYFASSPGWTIYAGGASNECGTDFATNFTAANAANLTSLCNQLTTILAGQTGNVFFSGDPNIAAVPAPCNVSGQCFSLIVKLPSTGLYYCASGKVGSPGNTSVGDTGTFANPGCWGNP